MRNESDWVIESQKKWLNFNLPEVWAYRDLLKLFVKRDFVSYYKQTILGPLWFLIQPLLTTFVFTLVFGKIGGFKTDGIPQPLFFMAGITAWNYFADCLLKCSTVFKDNFGIFNKVYFPRIIVPFSIVCSNLIKFGFQFLLLISMMFFYLKCNVDIFYFGKILIILPILIFIMAILGFGFGMLISAMTTKYRDLAFIISFVVQLMMFTTTVAFPLSSVQHQYHLIILLNPMTAVIETFRSFLFGTTNFNLVPLVYSLVVAICIYIIGLLAFNKVEQSFVDTI